MEEPADPAEKKAVRTLVRKLRRKADWESKADLVEEQAKDRFDNLFGRDQQPYSFYLGESETMLRRIAMAMNGTRGIPSKLVDQTFFVSFSLEAMEKEGLRIIASPGETDCGLVNSLHVEVVGTENQFRATLIEVIQSGRPLIHVTKDELRQFLTQANAEQCRAAISAPSGACAVEMCSPTT